MLSSNSPFSSPSLYLRLHLAPPPSSPPSQINPPLQCLCLGFTRICRTGPGVIVSSRTERVLCAQREGVDPVSMALEYAHQLAIRVIPGTYTEQGKGDEILGTKSCKFGKEENPRKTTYLISASILHYFYSLEVV